MNHGIAPDNVFDSFSVGQSDFNGLIRYAGDTGGRAFQFAKGAGRDLYRVLVGKEWLGYGNIEPLAFHRWPYVEPVEYVETEAEIVSALHREADDAAQSATCYFIGASEGPVKIGFSIDPPSRLRSLQYSSPVRLSILAMARGGPKRESAYHRQFQDIRLYGEWFERTPSLQAEIDRLNGEKR